MAVSAFAAATPLPMNSELVFLGLLAAGLFHWLGGDRNHYFRRSRRRAR